MSQDDTSNSNDPKLTEKMNGLPTIEKLPAFRYRWNTNEEVFIILTSMNKHEQWVADEVKIRPPNGSQLLYDRDNIKTRAYHNDHYYWKTRKNCNSSRVDHSSLRIRGVECIYCSYVHSALVPTFHRRCYWLLENPDIVLVHYLNLPDKNSTHESVLAYLLPYKDMNYEDLVYQLYPILAHSGDMLGKHKEVMNIDIKKLVVDLKTSKVNTLANKNNPPDNEASPGNATITSVSERQPQEKSRAAVTSQPAEKCTNCNQRLTIEGKTNSDKAPLNTVVAVTINRPISPRPGNQPAKKTSDGSPRPGTVTPANRPVNNQNCTGPAQDIVTSTKDANNNDVVATTAGCQGNARKQPMTSHTSVAAPQAEVTSLPVATRSPASSCNTLRYPMTSEITRPMVSGVRPMTSRQGMPTMTSPRTMAARPASQACMTQVRVPSPLRVTSQAHAMSPLRATSQAVHRPRMTSLPQLTTRPPVTSVAPVTPQSMTYARMPTNMMARPPVTSYQALTFDTSRTPTMSHIPSASNPSVTSHGTMMPHASMTSHQPMTSFLPMASNPRLPQQPTNTSHLPMTSHQSVTLHPSLASMTSHPSGTSHQPMTTQSITRSHTPMTSQPIMTSQPPMTSPMLSHFPSSDVACKQNGGQLDHLGVDILENEAGKLLDLNLFENDLLQYLPGCFADDAFPDMRAGVSSSLGNADASAYQQTAAVSASFVDMIYTDCHPVSPPPPPVSPPPPPVNAPHGARQNVITDFSPEWSYPEGKCKVLVLGRWTNERGAYTCLFDGHSVSASLIQAGVLRCYCPAHDPGFVALQVACDGLVISNACVFQYRDREKAPASVQDWLGAADSDLKRSILARIERLESQLNVAARPSCARDNLEERVITICRVLIANGRDATELNSSADRLTFLHVAAALGYAKLIALLRQSRADLIPSPWQPRAKDVFGCTPLMWACWRGHNRAALVLLSWQPSSYGERDLSGRSAKIMALEMGHLELVAQMEEFMESVEIRALSTSSANQVPLILQSSPSDAEIPLSPMSDEPLTWEKVDSELNCEMGIIRNEDRPNTLGKVLVEIRSLIEEAEQRAVSPFHSPDQRAPFTFATFSELPGDQVNENATHHDAMSLCSSSPARSSPSWSPGSPGLHHSPQSPGTDTSEFEEFLNRPRKFLERDFSELTLTDVEQQELLQAAKVIQNAYRQFKIRKKQHYDELKAAVLIQSYYRRYKQFALYKRITKAALLIQNSYRAHKEHEQFKKHRHAAAVIQNYFRHYRKRKQRNGAEDDAPGKRLGTKYRKPSYGK